MADKDFMSKAPRLVKKSRWAGRKRTVPASFKMKSLRSSLRQEAPNSSIPGRDQTQGQTAEADFSPLDRAYGRGSAKQLAPQLASK